MFISRCRRKAPMTAIDGTSLAGAHLLRPGCAGADIWLVLRFRILNVNPEIIWKIPYRPAQSIPCASQDGFSFRG